MQQVNHILFHPTKIYRVKLYSINMLLLLTVLQLFFCFTLAYENCGFNYYCHDRGSSIAYCCGYTNSGIPLCCSYTALWGLWYFWFGIVVGITLISACVTACCRKKSQIPNQRTVAVTRTTAVVTMAPNPGINNAGYEKEDLPPSYLDLQQQEMMTAQASVGATSNSNNILPPYPDVNTGSQQLPYPAQMPQSNPPVYPNATSPQ